MAHDIAREVFGLLFETSTEAVFVVDRGTGRIVSANVRAAEIFALELERLVGGELAQLSADSERALVEPGHYEDVELRRGDGFPIYVELNVAHISLPGYGDLSAYMARDTSERHSLERELRAKHTALYNAHAELERAHTQLSETKRELETRNREIALLAWRAAMGELVAGIAHHLNNPIGALSSTLRGLSRTLARSSSTERAELERLVERLGEITQRIETAVAAIVHATKSNAEGGASPRDLPPELANVLVTFVEQLDEIPTKERS